MPWCPKCNVEYKEGITVCADCNTPLVEKLTDDAGYVPFFMSEHKHIADKLKDYFEYSGVKSKINYSEEQDSYILSIPEEKQKQAKKLYQAFYFVERERIEKELASDTSNSPEDYDAEEAPEESSGEELPEGSAGVAARSSDNIGSAPDTEVGLDEDGPIEDGPIEGGLTEEGPIEDRPIEDRLTEEGPIEDRPIEDRLTEDGLSDIDESLTEPDGPIIDDLEDDDVPVNSRYNRDSGVYVLKSEKYKEYTSTVVVFTTVGILGLVFMFLNVVGILTIFSGWLPFTVMGALFLFFIFIGLTTNSKAKKMLQEVEEENRLTEQINKWLKDNVTEEFLASIHDENKSDELNYMMKTEVIKNRLLEEFKGADPAYLDRLIEEYYNANFETQA